MKTSKSFAKKKQNTLRNRNQNMLSVTVDLDLAKGQHTATVHHAGSRTTVGAGQPKRGAPARAGADSLPPSTHRTRGARGRGSSPQPSHAGRGARSPGSAGDQARSRGQTPASSHRLSFTVALGGGEDYEVHESGQTAKAVTPAGEVVWTGRVSGPSSYQTETSSLPAEKTAKLVGCIHSYHVAKAVPAGGPGAAPQPSHRSVGARPSGRGARGAKPAGKSTFTTDKFHVGDHAKPGPSYDVLIRHPGSVSDDAIQDILNKYPPGSPLAKVKVALAKVKARFVKLANGVQGHNGAFTAGKGGRPATKSSAKKTAAEKSKTRSSKRTAEKKSKARSFVEVKADGKVLNTYGPFDKARAKTIAAEKRAELEALAAKPGAMSVEVVSVSGEERARLAKRAEEGNKPAKKTSAKKAAAATSKKTATAATSKKTVASKPASSKKTASKRTAKPARSKAGTTGKAASKAPTSAARKVAEAAPASATRPSRRAVAEEEAPRTMRVPVSVGSDEVVFGKFRADILKGKPNASETEIEQELSMLKHAWRAGAREKVIAWMHAHQIVDVARGFEDWAEHNIADAEALMAAPSRVA